LRQEIPEVATGATQKPPSRSPELTGEALRLLIKVDKKVGLQELSLRFPDVLNRIADVWSSSGRAERCFDDLLLDARGTRQGFPQSVISEIASLWHYYLISEPCVFDTDRSLGAGPVAMTVTRRAWQRRCWFGSRQSRGSTLRIRPMKTPRQRSNSGHVGAMMFAPHPDA
jgi:hypothetical protein